MIQECRVATCGRRVSVKRDQLCEAHAERLRKYGDPLAGPPIMDRRPGRREYVIGEVEWFFECGVSPDLTMAALGYTDRGVIIRALQRWGRSDLAERFYAPHARDDSWFNQWIKNGEHRVA